MTTITSYNELKQNMTDFGKRPDALSKHDLFIDLCEKDINRLLRVTDMDASDTGATSTSVRYVALPTRFIEMRQILIAVDNVQYDMDASNINDMRIINSPGVPTSYIITNRIDFDRVSDQAYTLTYQFFQAPEPLSASVASNAILANYPMLYLSGCLKHLSRWAKNTDEADYWAQIFFSEISAANHESFNRRHPSGLSMKIHGGMIV